MNPTRHKPAWVGPTIAMAVVGGVVSAVAMFVLEKVTSYRPLGHTWHVIKWVTAFLWQPLSVPLLLLIIALLPWLALVAWVLWASLSAGTDDTEKYTCDRIDGWDIDPRIYKPEQIERTDQVEWRWSWGSDDSICGLYCVCPHCRNALDIQEKHPGLTTTLRCDRCGTEKVYSLGKIDLLAKIKKEIRRRIRADEWPRNTKQKD